MNNKIMNYFNGDDLATNVWISKYKQEGDETPKDMHRRLAKEFFKVENKYIQEEKNKTKETLSIYGKEREDLTEDKIFELFDRFKYIIPQGSVMSQLGGNSIGSLSNCFFINTPEDSYGGIFKKDEELVQLMKRRGGVGIDISTLRPNRAATTNAAKSSTGAVSFMHRFSNSTREVAQSGRRGALMISIDVKHPDVMEFIKVKRDLTQVTGANISIKVGDDFMKAVVNDEDYILRFPCDVDINLESPFNIIEQDCGVENLKYEELHEIRNTFYKEDTKIYVKKIKAKHYWEEIIKSAHQSAEPGILFWDTTLKNGLDSVYEEFKPNGVNPCGEITLGEYDSCRLIAVNLFSFVENPFTENAKFNFDKFFKINYEALRLSDDLVDLELQAIDKILAKIKRGSESMEAKRTEINLWNKVRAVGEHGRRTGLGFTALADMLAALNLKYDSEEAINVIKRVIEVKLESELTCSIDLSKLRGAFKGWSADKEYERSRDGNSYIKGKNDFYEFIRLNYFELFKEMTKWGRRNVSFSTIAPTGSVSILTQTTSGLEPLFLPYYMRRKKINPNEAGVRVDFVDQNGDSWQEFPVLHPKLIQWAWQKKKLTKDYLESLNKEDLDMLFKQSPWYGSTANDIDWVKRVEIQGILQSGITHSISSTINLPEKVSEEEVSKIYMEAWKNKLKGITIYRDNSRTGVLVSDNKQIVKFNETHAPKRPKSLEAKLLRFNNNKEKWIAFVGILDGRPYEIFTGKLGEIDIPTKIEVGSIQKNVLETGHKSYDFVYEGGVVRGIDKVFNNDFWNYAKLISSILRHGMPLPYVIGVVNSLKFEEDHINTWKVGLIRALKKCIDKETKGFSCSECGSTQVVFEEGCLRCLNCGSSKCG